MNIAEDSTEMSTPQTTVQRVLELAADHLEQFGWVRRMYGSRGKPCCVAGALRVAVSIADSEYTDIAWFAAAQWQIVQAVNQPVSCWNDKRGQTRANITRTLYRIAGVEL